MFFIGVKESNFLKFDFNYLIKNEPIFSKKPQIEIPNRFEINFSFMLIVILQMKSVKKKDNLLSKLYIK